MMRQKKRITLFVLSMLFLAGNLIFSGCQQKENEKYESTWESIASHPLPQWYDDAKLGIFIHWGVYSVPAYRTEWYAQRMHDTSSPVYDYHKQTYGDTSKFEYHEFLADFTAEKWDPHQWAKLFKEAGARYVVLTAEHHDGFPLWDCQYTQYDALDKGPKRNLVGELANAVRKQQMKFAGSFHGLLNYYKWPDWPQEISGKIPGHEYGEMDPAYLEYMRKKLYELLEIYKPSLLWLDGDWVGTAEQYQSKQLVADYYNMAQEWGKEVAVNDRLGKVRHERGDFYTPERAKMDTLTPHKWETCTSIDPHSWGYSKVTEESEYKTSNQIIDMLVDIVSKNGNLLLNVGPKADGSIPLLMQDRLMDLGRWLEVNGEAIYGTTYWKRFGEGDIRFTQKDDQTLYAIALTWPDEPITIRSLGDFNDSDIQSVSLLGTAEKVKWSLTSQGITIQPPSEKPCEHAFAFKIAMN